MDEERYTNIDINKLSVTQFWRLSNLINNLDLAEPDSVCVFDALMNHFEYEHIEYVLSGSREVA